MLKKLAADELIDILLVLNVFLFIFWDYRIAVSLSVIVFILSLFLLVMKHISRIEISSARLYLAAILSLVFISSFIIGSRWYLI